MAASGTPPSRADSVTRYCVSAFSFGARFFFCCFVGLGMGVVCHGGICNARDMVFKQWFSSTTCRGISWPSPGKRSSRKLGIGLFHIPITGVSECGYLGVRSVEISLRVLAFMSKTDPAYKKQYLCTICSARNVLNTSR